MIKKDSEFVNLFSKMKFDWWSKNKNYKQTNHHFYSWMNIQAEHVSLN
jgi:hypothetical protein